MASAARKSHLTGGARDNKLVIERVAAYARVSTEMQAEEGLSITAQLNEIREVRGRRHHRPDPRPAGLAEYAHRG